MNRQCMECDWHQYMHEVGIGGGSEVFGGDDKWGRKDGGRDQE